MRKIWIFVRSDGVVNTLRFIRKGMVGKFYHLSRTFCLYAENGSIKRVSDDRWKNFHLRVIKDWDELKNIRFDRLKLLPCQKWLENGSMVCVIFKGHTPVGFGWTHFNCHEIKSVGRFDMGTAIAWIGPIVVHWEYRGKGLQKWIIRESIHNAPAEIKAFITSVNAENAASLHSFEKCGFRVGMEVISKSGLFATKGVEVKRLDKQSESYLKIR